MKVIGSFVSPYVRKVLACMHLKGLSYEIDPITPFFGNDEFRRLSPLSRIPVLIDGDFGTSDSSVICADTRLGDLFIWGLFYQRVVRPLVWGEPGDEQRIAKTLNEDAPAALDYLEGELPESGWLFRDFGLADIAIASFFRNAAYAGFEPDADRWPRVAAFVQRALAHDAFASTLPFEDIQRSVDIKGRRQALLDAGAPLAAKTLGTPVPRKGMMRL
jgi:glutathione S-transferase